MKRKILIVFMIIFTIYISIILLVSFICGAPVGSREELNRYLFGAVGMSIVLPSGFSFFFMRTLYLSKRLEEIEEEEEERNTGDIFETMDINVMIRNFVNALSKKKNLTREKSQNLISYIEDL